MAIKTIYKYEVPGKITAKVKRFLQPHMQYGKIMIWAELDEDAEERDYYVIPVGTGWIMEPGDGGLEIMEHGIYCGTVMADPFVWHIYAGDMEKCGLNLDPCFEIENPF